MEDEERENDSKQENKNIIHKIIIVNEMKDQKKWDE